MHFWFNQKNKSFIIWRVLANRNITATLASLLVAAFYFLQQKFSWPGLQMSGIRGSSNYIDQESVLNSARCFKEIGISVYEINTIPDGCGGFVYSIELLRVLNFFHLSNLSSEVLGTIYMWLTILALCSVFFCIKNFRKGDYLVAAFALVSPGIWLLLERGNYDEVVFILAILAGSLLSSKYQEFGMVLLAASVLIKFYTLPAFLLAIIFLKRKNSKIIFGAVACVVTVYVVFLVKQIAAFPSTWYISFGLDSLGLYLNLFTREKISQDLQIPGIIRSAIGVGFIAVFILYFTRIKLISSGILINEYLKNRTSSIYNTLLFVFLSCFFAGMNYDYRLVYLAVLIALTPAIFSRSGFKRVITISGCVALCFSTFAFGLSGVPVLIIQFIGDVTLYIFISAQLLYLYKVYFESHLNHYLKRRMSF